MMIVKSQLCCQQRIGAPDYFFTTITKAFNTLIDVIGRPYGELGRTLFLLHSEGKIILIMIYQRAYYPLPKSPPCTS